MLVEALLHIHLAIYHNEMIVQDHIRMTSSDNTLRGSRLDPIGWFTVYMMDWSEMPAPKCRLYFIISKTPKDNATETTSLTVDRR